MQSNKETVKLNYYTKLRHNELKHFMHFVTKSSSGDFLTEKYIKTGHNGLEKQTDKMQMQ